MSRPNSDKEAAPNPESSGADRMAIDRMMSILDLKAIGADHYRGESPQDGWQRVYGGQVIGQALVAASKTVTDRQVHSLHGYFLRPGDPDTPITYEVERVRDGSSFCTRRVVAFQHGKQIFIMSASFQVPEEGLDHQIDMDVVAEPETLMGEADIKTLMLGLPNIPESVKRYWERDRPIEIRPFNLTHYVGGEKLPPKQQVWVRSSSPISEDPALHKCALAYMSDMTLLDTSLFAHGLNMFAKGLQMASLDHAMWFHRPFDAHEWMLYIQDSPSASNARGFCRGAFYNRNGKLIASVAQEGLIRQTA